VVAAVLRDPLGRVLLAQRRVGSHLAGLWEFPGGNVEAGEDAVAALVRELHEELGVGVDAASVTPLHRVPWHYDGQRPILIDAYEVGAFDGAPQGREGQAVRWQALDAIAPAELPAADGPLLTALRLPRELAISPEPADEPATWRARLQATTEAGARLLLLRSKRLAGDALVSVVADARERCRNTGARLLLSDHPRLARELGLDGVHLSSAELRRLATPRAGLPSSMWLGASCHDAEELALAERAGCDYVSLSPVQPTASHPGVAVLGWQRFEDLARSTPLPVFALGGMAPAQLDTVRARGGFGTAGIRAYWRI
jgi:8-oxo-dGTP diphosphatase